MWSPKDFKCPWYLVSAAASVLIIAPLIHFILLPSVPSFHYIDHKTGEFNPPEHSLHGSKHTILCPDSSGTIIYPGARWKPTIGQWLAHCDEVSSEVSIIEEIGSKACKENCNGNGVCNHELGKCRCFHGYTGEGCSEILQLNCNYPANPSEPFGRWVVSMCPTHCDTTRAMCFCGEGSNYPNRPVAESCGFEINLPSTPDGPALANWSKADIKAILSKNASDRGWCNVDPKEAYDMRVKFKDECDCKYDCFWGQFCEIPVQCTCFNQCSGNGHCRGGFCECHGGWYGVDCSIPSVTSPVSEWPLWLRPAHIEVSSTSRVGERSNLNSLVKKKSPLIYIYDLPPEFNSLLLEGRHFKFQCVNRFYDGNNATMWTDQLYGSQFALYESMLASRHRTLNGEEADFFYVPVLDSCLINRADDSPHLSMEGHNGLRSSMTLDFYKKAYDHIAQNYPYWNRTFGRDHIWFFAWDEGACSAPREIWNSLMLVHWGNTNTKHNHSTTTYPGDNWDSISPIRRGNHPCFDPDKDIVLPAWKNPDQQSFKEKFWARKRELRTNLFYFNGNLGSSYSGGRPEDLYSMGLRQKLAQEFGSVPNKKGKLGKQHVSDVIVTSIRTATYFEDLSHSLFCGVLPGDGWSGRMEDSIHQGCIPVVIQDGIYLPYENVLDYESFAVRILEDDIPNMVNILRGINETEIALKLGNVQSVWPRFVYKDSILLEAKRQLEPDWASPFFNIDTDDVFATLVRVLHFKLHNDPWRGLIKRPRKEFGLPTKCLKK